VIGRNDVEGRIKKSKPQLTTPTKVTVYNYHLLLFLADRTAVCFNAGKNLLRH